MQDFKDVETTALVDLLARYTAQYTNKIIERNSNIELGQYEYEIALIQSELNARKLMAADNAGNVAAAELAIPAVVIADK